MPMTRLLTAVLMLPVPPMNRIRIANLLESSVYNAMTI
jgi:hypothetical protein